MQLFRVFSADAALIAIVFLIALALLVFAFARGKSGELLLGLLIYIWWIVSSPFIYVDKTVRQIAASSRDKSNHDPENEQYLISRWLLILRGAVVAVALVILASSVASGWEDFLPSKWLRMQESALSKERSNTQLKVNRVTEQIRALDSDWRDHKDDLIKKRQDKRSQDASAAAAANRTIENNLASDPSASQSLKTLKAYLDRQKHDSLPAIDEARRTAGTLIQEVSLANPDVLNTYVENWHASYLNALPETLSPDEMRNVIQPDLATDKNDLQVLNDNLTALNQQIQNVQREEEYHPGDFLLDIMKGVFAFIFFVWGLGLLLEALLLGVFIARDVHLIRLGKQPAAPETATE